MRRAAAVLALAAGLSGASAPGGTYMKGGQPGARPAPPAAEQSSARRVASQIRAVNEMEVKLGRLARKKGATAAVRRYGQLLERDHRYADRKLAELARRERIALAPPAASAGEAKMAAKLASLSGKAFDRQFLADMQQGHERAIELLRQAQGQLADANLREFVAKLIPILDQHRQLSRDLKGKA